ncbi:MAG: hypothetical protein ABW200_07395 [Hyphomicrobiaceae bacterium]|jgi:hypothetical protein
MAGVRAVGSATEGGQHMLRSCALFAISMLGTLCAPGQPTIATAVAQILTVEEQQLADTYFSDCAKDWDASTHMTRVEWDRTCRRVATERARFRIQQQTEPRSKQN